MNDPYSVLGVDPSASDDQIKKAYRNLARKYHPDNYQNNPLADLAEEKMKEINEAYDTITRSRSGSHQSQSGGSYSQYSGPGGNGYQRYQNYQDNRDGGFNGAFFGRVRQTINQGNLSRAEEMLRSSTVQNAEWHYLSGYIAYKKGWLDEASQHFQMACSMDPNNVEYRQALSMMQQGGMGFRPDGYGFSSGCDPCTTCMCISCVSPCC